MSRRRLLHFSVARRVFIAGKVAKMGKFSLPALQLRFLFVSLLAQPAYGGSMKAQSNTCSYRIAALFHDVFFSIPRFINPCQEVLCSLHVATPNLSACNIEATNEYIVHSYGNRGDDRDEIGTYG